MGLQRRRDEYRRRDPARLRTLLDGGRTFVRAHSHPQGCAHQDFLNLIWTYDIFLLYYPSLDDKIKSNQKICFYF